MPHTRSSLLRVSPVWQHPFLNVFRHFKVHEWKRSTKEGDVAAVMVSGPGDLAEGVGSPLFCLGHFAPPPKGLGQWGTLTPIFFPRTRP